MSCLHLLKCTWFQIHSVSNIKSLDSSGGRSLRHRVSNLGKSAWLTFLSDCHMPTTVLSAVHILPHLILWNFLSDFFLNLLMFTSFSNLFESFSVYFSVGTSPWHKILSKYCYFDKVLKGWNSVMNYHHLVSLQHYLASCLVRKKCLVYLWLKSINDWSYSIRVLLFFSWQKANKFPV